MPLSPEEIKYYLSSLSMQPNEAQFAHDFNQNILNQLIKLSFVSIAAPFASRREIVSMNPKLAAK
jgi:hypothetical protein